MIYHPHRDESEETIARLTERYPKAFFVVPQQRKPLKKNILADLQKDGAPFAYELLSSALDWYQNHFGYQYALEAGAKRVDLNGKEVGTVTEQEQRVAQIKIKEGKRRLSEKNRNAVETLHALHEQGRIPVDAIKKLDAPPRPKEPTMKSKDQQPASELAKVHEALAAAGTLISEDCDVLRSAMAVAALGVVIREAQRVIDGLQQSSPAKVG